MIEATTKGLSETKWWEFALRFAFGGTMTAATGLLGHFCGPLVAGVFLAFPAILPASLTLVAKKDGRAAARDDSKGAVVGSVGLVAFAVVVMKLGVSSSPALTLLLATGAWALLSFTIWWAVFGRR